ncbi:MAG: DUF4350 domain-containing protein [Acidobacteriia bacterium]|nr:DUF4350 domain-containing protein [Terriglobia bacterium]
MPLNIAKSDRRLLMWAGLIIFPIIVALALAPRNEEESGVPSSYSAQSRGAKAAFLLLQESGYNAERWDDPPGDLRPDAAGTVLVMAFPFREPTPEDKNALVGYLSRGGKILITGTTVGRFLPQAEVENEPLPSLKSKEYQPQLLTSLTRGGAVEMSPAAYWKNSSTNYLVHYADGDRPIVVSYQYGKGQVTWWGATGPLTNAGIRNSGNMALFLNSVGEAGHVHVFWDEYFHGSRGSLGSYVAATPIKYGLLQGLFVFLALLLTYSRRNGPIHPAQETSRLSPLEFVETLGGLYRRARATSAALEVPYARFRSIATRRLGLPSDVPVDALASAIQTRLGYKDAGLADLLHRVEGTVGRYDLKEDDVLELVQELSRHMIALKFVAEDDLLRKNN